MRQSPGLFRPGLFRYPDARISKPGISMIAFLHWLRSILMGAVNGIAKLVVVFILLILALIVFGLVHGDGMPANMVLAMDLREAIPDSATTSFFATRKLTVMDVVLGLDAAGRDSRVKGVVIKLGNGALSSAQGEEIATAIQRFRAKNKFVIAQASAFFSAGLGDYVA